MSENDKLPWHARFARAVGRLTIAVGLMALLFGVVALGAIIFLLLTGRAALVVAVS